MVAGGVEGAVEQVRVTLPLLHRHHDAPSSGLAPARRRLGHHEYRHLGARGEAVNHRAIDEVVERRKVPALEDDSVELVRCAQQHVERDALQHEGGHADTPTGECPGQSRPPRVTRSPMTSSRDLPGVGLVRRRLPAGRVCDRPSGQTSVIGQVNHRMGRLGSCHAGGAQVTLVVKRGPARLGGDGALSEVRTCTNPDCRTNASIQRPGDTPEPRRRLR